MQILAGVAGMSSASFDDVLLALLFPLLFGLMGYRISSRHRVLRGVTPWRFPSVVWALICFVIGPIGIVVELLAEVTTKPRLPSTLGRITSRFDQNQRIGVGGGGAPSPVMAPVVVDVRHDGPPPPRDADGRVALFGWYADPAHRHQLRYFDGRRWSEFVADQGTRGTDSL